MHFRECGLIKKSINSKEDKKKVPREVEVKQKTNPAELWELLLLHSTFYDEGLDRVFFGILR